MKVVATIQARYSSKRFPGKVLKKIGKKTILEILVERLKKSKYINKIYISTSRNKSNIKLINFNNNSKQFIFLTFKKIHRLFRKMF